MDKEQKPSAMEGENTSEVGKTTKEKDMVSRYSERHQFSRASPMKDFGTTGDTKEKEN